MTSRILFTVPLLSVLLSLFVAVPAQAAVLNLLPDGMSWQTGGHEISTDIWNARTQALKGCTYTTEPSGCQNDVYAGRISQSECRRIASPDTCSTNIYIPEESRSDAQCTIVRIHNSATDETLDRVCAACSGSSCDFFLGMGPISTRPSDTNTSGSVTPEPTGADSDAPLTGPGVGGAGAGSGGNGTGGTGNGNGEVNNVPDAVLENPLNSDSLEDLLLAVLRGIVRIAAIALLLFLVYVGFQFVAAQGNEEKLRTARNALIWTVVGGVILLGAEVIMGVIQATIQSLAI